MIVRPSPPFSIVFQNDRPSCFIVSSSFLVFSPTMSHLKSHSGCANKVPHHRSSAPPQVTQVGPSESWKFHGGLLKRCCVSLRNGAPGTVRKCFNHPIPTVSNSKPPMRVPGDLMVQPSCVRCPDNAGGGIMKGPPSTVNMAQLDPTISW